MAIPAFREDGWLPEGHWPATWEEVEHRFAGETETRRRTLFERLVQWAEELRSFGLSGRLILDGSFISSKLQPGDIDGFLIVDDRTVHILADEPGAGVLISLNTLKERGIGDILCYTEASVRNYPSFCRIDGFDLDKHTARPKGLVEVPL